MYLHAYVQRSNKGFLLQLKEELHSIRMSRTMRTNIPFSVLIATPLEGKRLTTTSTTRCVREPAHSLVAFKLYHLFISRCILCLPARFVTRSRVSTMDAAERACRVRY